MIPYDNLKEHVSKPLPKLSTTRLILAATALVVVYFLAAGVLNLIHSQQLRQQETGLEADIQQIQQHYQRLQDLRQYLSSDQYIETIARQQLGLVQEGETGFVIISTLPPPTPAPGEEADPELWWDVITR